MHSGKSTYRDYARTLGGLRLHYLGWGDRNRPPMVLLHGITTQAHIWDTFAAAASHHYRVLALDQRGHGETSWAASYTTTDFVVDLHAFVQVLRLPPVVLVGLSMGAHNGMAYTARYPDRCRNSCWWTWRQIS